MNITEALCTARKLLGPKAQIWQKSRAKGPEARVEAATRLPELTAECERLSRLVQARSDEILAADEELQRLREARKTALKQRDEARSVQRTFRYQVGITHHFGGLGARFIEAEGDTLADLITKLKQRNAK